MAKGKGKLKKRTRRYVWEARALALAGVTVDIGVQAFMNEG